MRLLMCSYCGMIVSFPLNVVCALISHSVPFFRLSHYWPIYVIRLCFAVFCAMFSLSELFVQLFCRHVVDETIVQSWHNQENTD